MSVRLWFVPAPEALQSDRLEGTLDYAQVYAALQIIMDNPHNLLESLAYDMAHALLVRFPILRQVWLSVRKDTPPVALLVAGPLMSSRFAGECQDRSVAISAYKQVASY